MDLLWKKQSNDANALYVDIFKNINTEYPYLPTISEYEADFLKDQRKSIDSPSNANEKNIELSTEYLVKGEEKFQVKKWTEAMHLYNQSLCFAPIDSENVYLAYANRSTCFLNLKMYEKCLVDIDLAIKSNYPQKLMPGSEQRRADCLKLKQSGDEREEYVPK